MGGPFVKILICTLFINSVVYGHAPHAPAPLGTLLVMDALGYHQELPRHFRLINQDFPDNKTLIFFKVIDPVPSRTGLDGLRCSGSAQWSAPALKAIEALTGAPLLMVDLRLEPHGFIGNHAVSWYAPGNRFYPASMRPVHDQVESHLLNHFNEQKIKQIHHIKEKYNKQILSSTVLKLSTDLTYTVIALSQ
jgi:hypothetical protein